MKTIFRFLSVGMLVVAFAAVGSTSVFAQDVCGEVDAQTALQDEIRAKYTSKEVPVREQAVEAGKKLLEKYGSCEFSKEFVDWLKPLLPKWEAWIAEQKNLRVRGEILKRFDDSIKAKNWDAMYTAGEEFLAKYPNDPIKINIMIPLAVVGLYESYPPAKNYKYNDRTIKYANMSIAQIKGGDQGTKGGKYGVFQFECAKDDCLSEMTYALGYINYWAKGDKKAGLPYYYESLQMPGRNKNNPLSYATIGGYYQDEAARLGKEYADLVKTRNEADPEDVAADKEAKIKAAEGMLKAYLDRAIDAFSRAYNAAPKDAASKPQRDGFYKTVEDLYALRFQKKDGLDAYIAATVAKPMPNPTTAVTPVVEAESTTGSPSAASVNKPAVSAVTSAKSSGGEMGGAVKPDTTAVPSSKAVAKKPAARKKGTR